MHAGSYFFSSFKVKPETWEKTATMPLSFFRVTLVLNVYATPRVLGAVLHK